MATQDITGQKFNRLTAVAFVGRKEYPSGQRQQLWRFKCDCGNETVALANLVKRGKTRSCGCFQAEVRSESHTTHGHWKNRRPTTLRSTYSSMVQRTKDPKSNSYKYYGARGIRSMWKNFEDFLDDMGPSWVRGLTLDRIDNDGHYCKENCRWATLKQQAQNKRPRIRVYEQV